MVGKNKSSFIFCLFVCLFCSVLFCFVLFVFCFHLCKRVEGKI